MYSFTRVASLSALLLLGACSDYEFIPSDKTPGGGDGSDTPSDINEWGDSGIAEGMASVTGRVCDLTGDGYVVGATAHIAIDEDGDGAEDWRIEDVTDVGGYFTLEGVPLGNHTIVVEKGSFSTEIAVLLDEEIAYELSEEECLDSGDVNIAVITGAYDNIEHILDDMGLTYTLFRGMYNTEYQNLIGNPSRMAEFDIIFFNCGISDIWGSSGITNAIATNIRGYVEAGGSIYTADWSYFFFEKSFPSAITFVGNDSQEGSAYVGNQGDINGDVLDANMQAILGTNTAQLRYDLASWAVAESAASSSSVLIEGMARTMSGNVTKSPLAAKIHEGSGTALYTSFHNERQLTTDMAALLAEIILSL